MSQAKQLLYVVMQETGWRGSGWRACSLEGEHVTDVLAFINICWRQTLAALSFQCMLDIALSTCCCDAGPALFLLHVDDSPRSRAACLSSLCNAQPAQEDASCKILPFHACLNPS